MSKTIVLFVSVMLAFSLLSCNGNKQRPVDNPSIIDSAPQFEELPKSTRAVAVSRDKKLTVLDKVRLKENGSNQLLGTLTDYNNKKREITDFDGRPKLIGYWATWCKPCLLEKPHFLALSKQYPDIEFLSISIDKNLEKAKAFFASKGSSPQAYDYWIGYDTAQPLHWYTMKPIEDSEKTSITALPAYVFISAEGKILDNQLPKPSSGNIPGIVENYLAK